MSRRPADRARWRRTIGAAIGRGGRACLSVALALSFCGVAVRGQAEAALSAGSVLGWDKISGTTGNFTGSLSSDDMFGTAVANIGDLNNDGTNDLMVGASDDDDGGLNRGAVWVLFLEPDGTVGAHQKISSLEGDFGGALENLDAFGSSLGRTGDLDGDNIPDVVVGARLDDDGGISFGALWVLHMRPDGTVKSEQKISASVGGFGGALSVGDRFGAAVVALGDLDGDGVVDFAVGAPGDDDGATDAGAVWILFRNADGTVKSEAKISQTSGGFAGPLLSNEFFGASLAVIGDLNQDGIDELAVGAPYKEAGPVSAGRVFVLFLDATGAVTGQMEIATGVNGMPDMLDLGDGFGISLAGIGDINLDLVPDLAVGAHGDDDGGLAVGAVYTVCLNADGSVFEPDVNKISALSGSFDGDLDNLDAFGWGLTALGDFDGDLKNDLATGSWGDDDGGADLGALWCLYLDNGSGLSVTGATPDTGLFLGGTPVIVEGTGFDASAVIEVRFNGVPASDVSFVSDTELSCITPPGPLGASVKISVRQAGVLAGMEGAFTYVGTELLGLSMPAGNLLGGTVVVLDVLLGTHVADTSVTMGGMNATVLAADADSVTVVAPAVPEPMVGDVVLTNSNGSATLADAWTYTPRLDVELIGDAMTGGQLVIDLVPDPAAAGQFAWVWFGDPAVPDLNQTLTGIAGVLHESIMALLFQALPVDGNAIVLNFGPQHPSLAGIPVGVQAVVTGEGGFKGSFTNATSFTLQP